VAHVGECAWFGAVLGESRVGDLGECAEGIGEQQTVETVVGVGC
jgi:hypothetical protein